MQNPSTRARREKPGATRTWEDVWITDARVQGTVLSTHNTPRSYIVQVPHGTLRREPTSLGATADQQWGSRS